MCKRRHRGPQIGRLHRSLLVPAGREALQAPGRIIEARPDLPALLAQQVDAVSIIRATSTPRKWGSLIVAGHSIHTKCQVTRPDPILSPVIRRIFEKAIEYGLVGTNPVTPKAWLKIDRTPEETRAWWRPEETAKAFQTLESWRKTKPLQRTVILVQLITGIRFSEIRALEKRNLDLTVPEIVIRRSMARKKIGPPKNKHTRRQPIPRELAEELHRWMLTIPGDILFPGIKGGHLPNNSINRWYAQLCEEAGIQRITSHGARHTAGSAYDQMGLGQRMIADLLGHRDLGATEQYTHSSQKAVVDAIERRWRNLRR